MQLDPDTLVEIRAQFPALSRQAGGKTAVYLDGPAGSQVPQSVIRAISDCLAKHNANHGGEFPTSRESDQAMKNAHEAVADFLGADDPACIHFGANMTSLTFAFSRALARTWDNGDEVVVTHLDHDGNHTPWKLAARDAGVTVRNVGINPADCTLDMDDLASRLSGRTRLVAVTAASNLSGSLTPVKEISRMAHEAGAEVFVDAVHYAPHRAIDVRDWDCDYLVCSAYKFFGPHVGILWGQRERMEAIEPYKLRTSPENLPGRWMTGTQNHEGIHGVKAAVDYLASVAGESPTRREGILASMDSIRAHEAKLSKCFLDGLATLEGYELVGIADTGRLDERVPTFSLRHPTLPSRELARKLGDAGIFTWHGNFYALPVTEFLGHEPDGLLRAGFLHYNTEAEVDRLLEELGQWL